jgi:hypothetical protein
MTKALVRRDEQDRKARRVGARTCFWRSIHCVAAGESRALQNLPARCLLSRSLKLKRPNVFTFGRG